MSTRFTALTIKEGDAFLLEDDGWNCLFDSGIDESTVDLLRYKEIDILNLAICSHNDADHANGFIELLESSLEIDEIWLPYWWASILDYSNNHDIDWEEIEDVMKKMNKSKIRNADPGSFFSDEHEPLTDEAFDGVLSKLAQRYRQEQNAKLRHSLYHFIKSCLDKKLEKRLDKELSDLSKKEDFDLNELAHSIKIGIANTIDSQLSDENLDRIVNEIAQRLADIIINSRIDESIGITVRQIVQDSVYSFVDENSQAISQIIESRLNGNLNQSNTVDIAHKLTPDLVLDIVNTLTDKLSKYLIQRATIYLKDFTNSWPAYERNCLYHDLRRDCIRFFLKYEEKNKADNKDNNSSIMFNNIMEIAVLAHERNCTIKWFEPMRSCVINPKPYCDFLALNSTLKRQVQRLKNVNTFAFALYLTEVNQYSLVFEYLKDGIPILRFSADSDSTCQSQNPYPENIIVTAPHHGAKANAKVYSAIQGDDIIWVRSDKISGNQGRPCDVFKSMKNKYCLACETYNFESEICFEYDSWLKQWHHVRGERCRCKGINN